MVPYELPPQLLAPDDGALAPIELPGGPELVMGRLPSPFGAGGRIGADRGAQRRMADTEQELVSQGLPLAVQGNGIAARFGEDEDWSLDAAVVVAGGVGDLGLQRGLAPPDLATRGAVDLGAVEVGTSVWLGGLGVDDHAFGADAEVDAGRWTLGAALSHQRVGSVKRVFEDPPDAQLLYGEGVSVAVGRELRPQWSASAVVESQVFRTDRRIALTPWARGALGLTYEVRRALRWTVVEVAEVVTLGPSDDCQRISTRIELR